MVATGFLVYVTFDAVRKSDETNALMVKAAGQAMLLEDIRAEYINAWTSILSTGPAIDDRFIERFELARRRADAAFAQLLQNAQRFSPDEQDQIADLASSHARVVRSWTPILALLLDGREAEAHTALAESVQPASEAFIDQLTVEVQRHHLELNQALRDSEASRGQWENVAFLIGALWVLVLIGGGYASTRWLLRPLTDLARATRLMAAGEMASLAPIKGPAEVARLASDVNMMALSLLHRSEELNQYLSKNLEARTAELEIVVEALRSSEARLEAVIESAPLILFALNRDGAFTLSKGKGLQALGLEAGALEGRAASEVFNQDSEIREKVERVLAGESFSTEIRLDEIVFDTHFASLRDESGKPNGVIGVAVDISERIRMNEALRQTEERYRELFENANDIVYTQDIEGNFTSMNKAGVRVLGYADDEIASMSIADVMTPEMLEYSRRLIDEKLSGMDVGTTQEIELLRNDGQIVPLEVSTQLIFEAGKPVAIQAIGRDISDRRLAEAAMLMHTRELETLNEKLAGAHSELEQSKHEVEEKSRQLERALELERAQARIDALTGALNHGAIVEELRQAAGGAADTRVATIVMADIDGMKAANDLYGHQFGDQVLIAVKEAMDRDGAIVGRYGGDEFVAVLKGAGREAAEAYRRTVLEAIEQAGLKDPEAGTEISILLSVGYSVYPDDASRMEELIALADTDMYAQKQRQPAVAVEAAKRRMGGDRAVRLVGEIVPVLTSPGDPRDHLAFVCQRLALDCGYDGVEIMMNPWMSEGRDLVVAYPAIPQELQAAWLTARSEYARDHPLTQLLERTRRPVIIDQPQEDERMAGLQREAMRRMGVRSVMVAPLFWERNLIGSLSAASRLENAFSAVDAQVLLGIASQVSAILSMAVLLHDFRDRSARLASAHTEGVRLLSWTIEAQAGVPSHDFERLRTVAESLARKLGYGAEEAVEIGLAATLHDVGKYRVPPDILARPKDLLPDEWEIMKRHTIWGSRLLQGHPAFELASHVARWHHERWDGHGYPDGLVGDEIPVPVAIASVADALDAMIYDRVYRPGMPPAAALEQVIGGSGDQFNPRVVDALVRLFEGGELQLRQPGGEQAAA